jgi:hypothetical protein
VDLLAIGEMHFLGGPIESGGRHAEPPTGVDRPPARQLGVIGRHRPQQDLLRQRRAIVRFVRLVADDRKLPAEALLAQRLGSAEAGQRGADDDDLAAAARRTRRRSASSGLGS